MNFLWALLLVVVLPPLLGGLFALLLREVHIRHPLPLGGTIVQPREYAKRKARLALLEQDALTLQKNREEDHQIFSEEASSPSQTIHLGSLASLTGEESLSAITHLVDSGVSIFNDSKYSHLPSSSEQMMVDTILESMLTETPEEMSSVFEHRIEEAASQTQDKDLSALQDDSDDMNDDDLQALSAALPGGRINFSQELDDSPIPVDPISPMAKELLGENFDFSLLEKMAKDDFSSSVSTKEAVQETNPFLKTEIGYSEESNVYEPAIDIQDDSNGNIRATSMLVISDSPRWAALTDPQMVSPTFSDVWIQEKGTDMGLPDSEAAKFCFNEESRPMFFRKRKNC